MKKNLEIERLRAIAVVMVIVAHCNFIKELLPQFFRDPITGVDLFFVISGYVVTASLLRSLPDFTQLNSASERFAAASEALKKFFLRRIFRILPAAYFWLGIYFLLAIIFGGSSAYLVGTPQHIFKEIVYFSSGFYNYLGYKGDMAVHHIGHYWSLTVEEHFYLILPFFLVCVSTKIGRILGCLIMIFIVAAVLRPFIEPNLMEPHSFNFFTSHRRFDTLGFGVLLALLRYSRNGISESGPKPFLARFFLANILPLFFLTLLWCGVSVLPVPFNVNLGLTVYAMFGTGLVFLATFERNYIFGYKYLREALEYIGERSYTIYLSHIAMLCLDILLVNWLEASYSETHLWLTKSNLGIVAHFVLVLSATIVVSDIGYRVVEKPLIKYAKRHYS